MRHTRCILYIISISYTRCLNSPTCILFTRCLKKHGMYVIHQMKHNIYISYTRFISYTWCIKSTACILYTRCILYTGCIYKKHQMYKDLQDVKRNNKCILYTRYILYTRCISYTRCILYTRNTLHTRCIKIHQVYIIRQNIKWSGAVVCSGWPTSAPCLHLPPTPPDLEFFRVRMIYIIHITTNISYITSTSHRLHQT